LGGARQSLNAGVGVRIPTYLALDAARARRPRHSRRDAGATCGYYTVRTLRSRSLPDVAALSFGPDHGCVGLATPRFLKFGQVRQWTITPVLRNRMRIALHHQASRFRTNLVSAKLSPCNEELLLGVKPSTSAGLGFPSRDFHMLGMRSLPAQVSDALAENQFPVVVDVFLDEVVIELIGDTGPARLEVFQVGVGPQLRRAVPENRNCAPSSSKAMRNLVANHDSDGAVVHRIDGIHVERRRLQDSRGNSMEFISGPVLRV